MEKAVVNRRRVDRQDVWRVPVGVIHAPGQISRQAVTTVARKLAGLLHKDGKNAEAKRQQVKNRIKGTDLQNVFGQAGEKQQHRQQAAAPPKPASHRPFENNRKSGQYPFLK